MKHHCCDPGRLDVIRRNGSANAIAFIEVFAGGALHLAAASDVEPRELVLRDCTLVPGRTLNPDGGATAPGEPSLMIEHPFAKVTIERCITGPLHVVDAEVTLTDCIVDAGAADNAAYAADGAGRPARNSPPTRAR